MDGKDIKRFIRFLSAYKAAIIPSVILLVVVIASVSLWYAISGVGRRGTGGFVILPSFASTTVQATSGDMLPRAIDGVMVASGTEALPSFAVMIDGHMDARPVSGLARANLVFDVPVEGGIPRYMAVFDASNTSELIGPVRSARQYFVELADGLGAVYAHVGGSPQALSSIKSMSGFDDLNEYFNGQYYWRSGKSSAPHNVYTRMDQLNNAFSAKSWSAGHLASWMYKDDDTLDGAASTTMRGTASGPLLAYVNGYAVSWSYDRASNAYVRKQGAARQTDADGSQVSAKNVIVVSMHATVIDEQGRLAMTTTGRGKARLYHDGYASDAVWHRRAGEGLTFETVDGADLLFNRGTTWVEIVSDPAVFDFSTSSTSP